MNKENTLLIQALTSLYYMMGLVEASDTKAHYDFVLEVMNEIEKHMEVES